MIFYTSLKPAKWCSNELNSLIFYGPEPGYFRVFTLPVGFIPGEINKTSKEQGKVSRELAKVLYEYVVYQGTSRLLETL